MRIPSVHPDMPSVVLQRQGPAILPMGHQPCPVVESSGTPSPAPPGFVMVAPNLFMPLSAALAAGWAPPIASRALWKPPAAAQVPTKPATAGTLHQLRASEVLSSTPLSPSSVAACYSGTSRLLGGPLDIPMAQRTAHHKWQMPELHTPDTSQLQTMPLLLPDVCQPLASCSHWLMAEPLAHGPAHAACLDGSSSVESQPNANLHHLHAQ